MTLVLIALSGLLLAYANGANDNSKGVATLLGSGVANYRRALAWATATTCAGSLVAVWLSQELLKRFSGKGLVAEELTTQASFVAAVALAAACTVLLATRIGMPVSTTHALMGGLTGAGLASDSVMNWATLQKGFVLPLLLSPLVAVAGAAIIYPVFRWTGRKLALQKDSCLCFGVESCERPALLGHELALVKTEEVTASVGATEACDARYAGWLLRFNAGRILDGLHYLSAGLVGFARGLNDTPKIAAILLLLPWLGPQVTILLCGVVIALGGLISARRVAETMSKKITSMDPSQGFSANLVTGILVTAASIWALPVSTTHVSCGSLFGLGICTGQVHWRSLSKILAAWVTTLPTAGVLGWVSYRMILLITAPPS